MENVGVMGIRRECLLATDLRVEKPASLHVSKARLIKRGGRLGSSGGGPAFAAAHQHISCGQSTQH